MKILHLSQALQKYEKERPQWVWFLEVFLGEDEPRIITILKGLRKKLLRKHHEEDELPLLELATLRQKVELALEEIDDNQGDQSFLYYFLENFKHAHLSPLNSSTQTPATSKQHIEKKEHFRLYAPRPCRPLSASHLDNFLSDSPKPKPC